MSFVDVNKEMLQYNHRSFTKIVYCWDLGFIYGDADCQGITEYLIDLF